MMNKKITMAILLTVLVLSFSMGVVTAKRPDKPGKTTPETALFKVWINGDLDLLDTTDYPEPLEAEEPTRWWHPDDIYTRRAGGEIADQPKWYFTEPGFGYFDMSGLGVPQELYDSADSELVEIIGLEHYRYDYNENTGSYNEDFWFFWVKWNKDVDPDDVGDETLYLVFRTNRDPTQEGKFYEEYELSTGIGETWIITFTDGNTELALINYYKVVSREPVGNSGKFRTKTESVTIWSAQDFSFTVTVEKV